MRTTLFASAIAFCVTVLATLSADGATPLNGYWRFEKTGEVLEFHPCEGSLCATLVALPPGPGPTQDLHNPDPAKRAQPLCGLIVIRDLRPDQAGKWRGGLAYDPEDGKSYAVDAEPFGPNLIELRASLRGLPWLSESYRLRPTAPIRCD